MIPDHVTITGEGGRITLRCSAMTDKYGKVQVCGDYAYGSREAAEREAVSYHSHIAYIPPKP